MSRRNRLRLLHAATTAAGGAVLVGVALVLSTIGDPDLFTTNVGPLPFIAPVCLSLPLTTWLPRAVDDLIDRVDADMYERKRRRSTHRTPTGRTLAS